MKNINFPYASCPRKTSSFKSMIFFPAQVVSSHVLSVIIASTLLSQAVMSPVYAWSDPNPNDHTFDYGNGADLVPAECRSGNHLLWENKSPDTIYDDDGRDDKMQFNTSHQVFDTGDLPLALRNPPAAGTWLNVKSLGRGNLQVVVRPSKAMSNY